MASYVKDFNFMILYELNAYMYIYIYIYTLYAYTYYIIMYIQYRTSVKMKSICLEEI